MQITQIDVVLVPENQRKPNSKLRAYVNITIDDCFMVRGLKVINGRKGLFVAMPNKKGNNGLFRDMAHPINQETRDLINGLVLNQYQEALTSA